MVEITQNDFGFDLVFTVTDSSGTVVDISLATSMKFHMRRIGETSLTLNESCVLYTDGTDGKCKYTVQDGDMATAGEYKYEIEVTWASKKITAKPSDRINIVAQLD